MAERKESREGGRENMEAERGEAREMSERKEREMKERSERDLTYRQTDRQK